MTSNRIRPAVIDDAKSLAEMINYAGNGIPMWLWSRAAEEGQTALEVGQLRAARDTGAFSYRNAWVIDADDQPGAMLLGYRLPDPCDTGNSEEIPAVVRPLIELEAGAPGSWYINAIAVLPEHRGRGFGGRLMDFAETEGRRSGAPAISGIVAEENEQVIAMCRRRGYRPRDKRPIEPISGFPYGGDWVLLVKAL